MYYQLIGNKAFNVIFTITGFTPFQVNIGPDTTICTEDSLLLDAGNPTASLYADDALYGARGVWENGYTAVYHLNEDPTAGGNPLLDSTANQEHANVNASGTSSSIAGMVGNSVRIDGGSNFLRFRTTLLPIDGSSWSFSNMVLADTINDDEAMLRPIEGINDGPKAAVLS